MRLLVLRVANVVAGAALRLAETVAARIREHGARAYPSECCGALLGRVEEESKVAIEAMPLENARTTDRETRFLVGDDAYVRVEREADRRGLALLGFYHSHPDHPARPSSTDLASALPWFSNVILAVREGTPEAMTSWVLDEDRTRFREEPVELAPPPAGASSGAR